MRILRTVPNVRSLDLADSERFYHDTLGYDINMKLDWIVTFTSSSQPLAQLSAITHDPSGLHPDISIEVDDVNEAFLRMTARQYEVVYEPHDEPWGVRRFFVREPSGRIINVMMHKDGSSTPSAP